MKKLFAFFAILLYPAAAVDAQSLPQVDQARILEVRQQDKDNVTIGICGVEFVFGGSDDKTATAANIPGTKNKKSLKNRYYSNHLGIFEMGFNIVAKEDYGMYPDSEKGFIDLRAGKSIQLNFNILNTSVALNKARTLGFVIGLGIQFNNYRFSDRITLEKRDGILHPLPLNQLENFKKSKFSSTGIWIPVMFEATLADKMFISAGVYGALNLNDHTKYSKPKNKIRGIYMSPLSGGVTARMGFGKIYVFSSYALNSLFKKDKGPKVNILTCGLGIGF